MKLLKSFITISTLSLMIIGMCSCGQKINTSEVRKYSDDITENILVTLKTGDYNRHIKDYGDEMKKAVTEDAFKKMYSSYQNKIGDYVSKQFMTVQSKNGFIIAIYKAKFTKDSNVIVRIVFKPGDDKHLVQGEFYSSKNLTAK